MAETWKRLAGPATLTGSAATKYTVPATTKTVIRKIHFSNSDTSARSVTVSIGADAAGTEIVGAKSIPANDVLDVWGPFVMDAAEILQAFASVTSVVAMTVDGIEITLG